MQSWESGASATSTINQLLNPLHLNVKSSTMTPRSLPNCFTLASKRQATVDISPWSSHFKESPSLCTPLAWSTPGERRLGFDGFSTLRSFGSSLGQSLSCALQDMRLCKQSFHMQTRNQAKAKMALAGCPLLWAKWIGSGDGKVQFEGLRSQEWTALRCAWVRLIDSKLYLHAGLAKGYE